VRPTHLAAWLTLLLGAGAAPAAPNELGHPVLRHYTPGEYLRSHATSTVTQDTAGVMYFRNNGDLLTYDGAQWGVVRLPTESAGTRQFAVTADGTIYLGGASVLGYLRGTGKGAEYVSLVGQLPPAARNVEEIRYATAVGDAVYFSDEEKILIWRAGRFTVVPYPTPLHSHGARLHGVGDALYVTALGRGLGRFMHDAVGIVADDPVLRDNQIISVVAGPQGALVLLTAERGFFQLGADGRVAPLPVEANRWPAGKRIFRALRLADGGWVVAFSAMSGDGGMRFSADGQYQGPLDTSIGLLVKTVRDFFCDREGGLWLGMDTGMARLEWPSAVTVFDVVNGLGSGAVADVTRHEGAIYAATSEGFFRLVPVDEAGRVARFERIANARGVSEIFAREKSAEPKDTAIERLPHFVRATIGAVSRVHEEAGPDGPVLWVCGARGLARVEVARVRDTPAPFAAQLTATNVRAAEHLPTRHPALTFHYVAPRQRPTSPVTYQTRLTGLEDEWSEWSPKRERSFANLPSRGYSFEVRARDAAGETSLPAALGFVVITPWARTWWAFLGYAATGAGLVAGLVRLRTRALRARATRLEAIIAQRTSELAQKNLELLRLNHLALDENVAARLAEEKARLEVLRYQLNPHFLYNTLTSISGSLPAGLSTARTMVERLADFCRLTLHRPGDRDWTTLGEEWQILHVYLEIEQSRWGDLLEVAIACDPALEGERLPHFLLLPLVENALKYGRATSPDRVGLRLAARREAGSGTASRSKAPDSSSTEGTESRSATGHVLILEVSNTGTWIEPTSKKHASSLGIGLDNLRQRLTRYYPRSHELTVSHADGWVTVTLRLSARYQETGDKRPATVSTSPPSAVA